MSNPATQFKPGQSGNPNGRPKTAWDWKTLLKEEGDVELDGITKKKRVVEKTYEKAIGGDIIAAKAIMDRTDGLPQQKIDHTTDGEKITTPNLSSEAITAIVAEAEAKIKAQILNNK